MRLYQKKIAWIKYHSFQSEKVLIKWFFLEMPSFKSCYYRIYSNKHRSLLLIFSVSDVVLIQGRRLFEGGAL